MDQNLVPLLRSELTQRAQDPVTFRQPQIPSGLDTSTLDFDLIRSITIVDELDLARSNALLDELLTNVLRNSNNLVDRLLVLEFPKRIRANGKSNPSGCDQFGLLTK